MSKDKFETDWDTIGFWLFIILIFAIIPLASESSCSIHIKSNNGQSDSIPVNASK